ncbi:heavy metal translocating P-type ATPase [Halopiger djelfimassiliensis]|uniref:heavy metal translocating P-type ATPase n=1 Tax=Halopiger djelfimassiliensis TaxID=1293047 RepID=UPI000677DE77|nr:cation-translocating P-type ATPase [Halopiger djelfimassiliensis]
MSDCRSADDRCQLCGSRLSGTPVAPGRSDGSEATEAAADGPFCSAGCRDIAHTLDAPSDGVDEHDAVAHSPDRTREGTDGPPDDAVRTFLRIDGMHSALCESYLETVAESTAGVVDAAASYVTETVRVDHDPDRVSASALEDALSTTGYTAYLREDAAVGDDAESTGGTRRSREMQGLRKRRTEDMFEMRYIVGIVFGSFLLVPYAALLYPVYLASIVDWGVLGLYEDAFSGFDGILFLPVFFAMTGAVLYLTGRPLLRGAYVSLKLRQPSTHLLAALTIVGAYCYGTLAFFAGRIDVYYDLTILVAATVMAAFVYEATTKRRAMNQLTELTISQVDTARRYDRDGTTREVPVEDLESGDRVLVRAGERIPVDGTLAEGECTVDEAVVTGESLPVSKTAGDAVIGGSVVTSDAAVVDVGERTTSSIDRLTRDVWNLQSATHGVQRRVDRLAAAVVPVVLGLAAVVGIGALALGAGPMAAAMAVCLTVIAASPWALGLATPCSVASSIRDAMAHGIVVFDETVFERLRDVDVVVFDKTGTLTTGEMTVLEADAPDDLLRAVGDLERRASHPAAAAIADAFGSGQPGSDDDREPRPDGDPARSTDESRIEAFQTHETGVEGVVDGDRVLAGHPDLFPQRDWTIEPALESRSAAAREAGRLPVVVGRDGRAEGLVVVGDEPRAGWDETIAALDESGIDVVVLTGDDEPATDAFADHPGVDHVFAGVSPAGKTAAIRRLSAEHDVAMAGDGTNDAPALAEADLGVSLGSGTALASDAADLAIVDDDLAGVERAFALSKAARKRVARNLVLAFTYNAIVLPLAVLGVLNPAVTAAALLATGTAIVANSSRSLLE